MARKCPGCGQFIGRGSQNCRCSSGHRDREQIRRFDKLRNRVRGERRVERITPLEDHDS